MVNNSGSARIRRTVEIGLVISLAIVLSMLTRLVQMPWGGSINLGALPLAIMAIYRGCLIGAITGGLYGLLDLILNPFYVHPIQVILDYPTANAVFGLVVGYSYKIHSIRIRLHVSFFILLAGLLKFSVHWLSGMVFFSSFAPSGTEVWFYSAVYNATYVFPETILCLVAINAVWSYLDLQSSGDKENNSAIKKNWS